MFSNWLILRSCIAHNCTVLVINCFRIARFCLSITETEGLRRGQLQAVQMSCLQSTVLKNHRPLNNISNKKVNEIKKEYLDALQRHMMKTLKQHLYWAKRQLLQRMLLNWLSALTKFDGQTIARFVWLRHLCWLNMVYSVSYLMP